MRKYELEGFDLGEAIAEARSRESANPFLGVIGDLARRNFVKVYSIKKDEVNDGGDWFTEAESRESASPFLGVSDGTN